VRLWPHERVLGHELPSIADMETNIPYVDLEDKGDRFILSAETPGFQERRDRHKHLRQRGRNKRLQRNNDG
jgi:HSP20 family molecular chaperone IbpA